MDGVAGPTVWSSLLGAAANGQTQPERLHLRAGQPGPPGETHQDLAQRPPGAAEARPTPASRPPPPPDGTFPVYLRYYFPDHAGHQPGRQPSTPTPSTTCPTSTAATRFTTSPAAGTGDNQSPGLRGGWPFIFGGRRRRTPPVPDHGSPGHRHRPGRSLSRYEAAGRPGRTAPPVSPCPRAAGPARSSAVGGSRSGRCA